MVFGGQNCLSKFTLYPPLYVSSVVMDTCSFLHYMHYLGLTYFRVEKLLVPFHDYHFSQVAQTLFFWHPLWSI